MLRRTVTPLILWGLLLLGAAASRGDTPKEYQVKAVFLFNFCRFIEWPETAFESTNAPLVIAILGTDPFGDALDQVVLGETVNGHPVLVDRYRSVSALKPCHILFIAKNEEAHLADIFRAVGSTPTLTVSEIKDFARDRGIVRLYTNPENKIRVKINVDNAHTAGLKISSKLLTVSEVVGKGSP